MEDFQVNRYMPKYPDPSVPEPAPSEEQPYDPGYFPAPPQQPNLGYSVALLVIGFLVLIAVSVVVAIIGQAAHVIPHNAAKAAAGMPKASILLEAVTFAITLGIAALIFPRLWHRPFFETIHFNRQAIRSNIGKLALTAVAVSIVAQGLESLLTLPKQMPVDDFFKHPSDVWVIALFGTLVAPVCEEIFFRGFLLRGIAIAFDWVAARGSKERHATLDGSDGLSRRAMIFSGILSSFLFAAMHSAQLGGAWNAVAVLWFVGGVLTIVRIRFNSVAASSVVHAIYNGWIFIVIFVVTGGFRHLDKLTNH